MMVAAKKQKTNAVCPKQMEMTIYCTKY